MKSEKKITSIRELAEAVGASTATVSLVLNKKWDKKVKKSVAEKVLHLASKHDYSPNPLGKGLMLNKYYRISLVVDGNMLNHPLVGAFSLHDFIIRVSKQLNQAGYALDIMQVEDDLYEEIIKRKKITALTDGYIFIGWRDEKIKKLLDAIVLNKPYIVFDNNLKDSVYSYVYKDFFTPAREVGEYFGKAGHKRAAIIESGESCERFKRKVDGFRTGLAKYGVNLSDQDIVVHFGEESIKDGFVLTNEIYGKNSPPTALFCTDNICALGALWALDAMGVQVPEEAEIISYGDEMFAMQSPIPLSYIKIPSGRIADYCIEKMIAWIDGGNEFQPIQRMFTEKLIFGGTTRPQEK